MINGKDISHSYTLQSRYDNNSIGVYIKGKDYRLHSTEIDKLIKKAKFTEKKARVHTYLEVAK